MAAASEVSGHTPGSWKLDKGGIVRADAAEFPVAQIGIASTDPDESVSNGFLIAAAPELLEALERAQLFIRNGLEYGYITEPDPDDPAAEVPGLIDTALQNARTGR